KAHLAKFGQNELKEIVSSNQAGRSSQSLHNSIVNRIDMLTLAEPTLLEYALEIGRRQARGIIENLKNEVRIDLEISTELIEHLARVQFDMSNGARPIIKRFRSVLGGAIYKAR